MTSSDGSFNWTRNIGWSRSMIHPTTVLEMIQLVINGGGFALSLRHFVGTLHTYRYVQLAGIGNGRRIIAAGHVRSEALRLGAQGVLLLVAMIALLALPAPPAGIMPEKFLDWLLWRKFGIAIVSLLMICQTLGDASDRKILDVITDE